MTARDPLMDYRVFYPSGQRFTLRGRFCMAVKPHAPDEDPKSGLIGCAINLEDERLMFLDPRGVVVRGQLVIYEPRHWMRSGWTWDGLSQWVSEWLAEHPDWPNQLIADEGWRQATDADFPE